MKKCKICGNITDDSASFCSNCNSSDFTVIEDGLNGAEKICVSCGQKVSSSSTKCPFCGTPFNTSNRQQTSSGNRQTSNAQQQSGQKKQQQSGTVRYASDPPPHADTAHHMDTSHHTDSAAYEGKIPHTDSAGYVSYGYDEYTPPRPPKQNKTVIVLLIVAICLLLSIGGTAAVIYFTKEEPTSDNISTTTGVSSNMSSSSSSDTSAGSSEGLPTNQPMDTLVNTPTSPKRPKISHYKVYKSDITWTSASSAALSPNSTLVCINDADEFSKVCKMAEKAGLKVFWMGASVNAPSKAAWNSATWQDGSPVDYTKWRKNEPSLIDGNDYEYYLMAFYTDGGWYFNDAPNDVSRFYPGQMGYIVETTT